MAVRESSPHDTVTLTIDGRQAVVPHGTTVWEAARQLELLAEGPSLVIHNTEGINEKPRIKHDVDRLTAELNGHILLGFSDIRICRSYHQIIIGEIENNPFIIIRR